MRNEPAILPEDINQCHAIIIELSEKIRELNLLNEKHKHQLMRLLRRQYGQKADRLSCEQLVLWALDELDQTGTRDLGRSEPEKEEKKSRRGHGRRPLPKDLPRRQVIHDLAPEEKICTCCQTEKKKISEEVTEQLEYVPASFYVIEHVQYKYACPHCGEGVAQAPKPMQPIEKGIPGPGLLSHVIVSKYCDHQPLHRLEGILARHRVYINRSTMCGWIKASAELVYPLYELMCRRVLRSEYINTDDTPVSVLDRSMTRTRKGRIWIYTGDIDNPYVVFDYTPTRGRDGPAEFLKGYKGYLQADAYPGYDRLFLSGDIVEVGCLAHVRRKFHDAQPVDLVNASIGLAWIRRLYRIEKQIIQLAPEQKRHIRQEKSKPILDDFKQWLEKTLALVLPKNPLGQAVAYTLSNWAALNRYLENGHLAIDNNRAERFLRSPVVGRGNWLFYGSDEGGKRAAVLMSFIATCKDLNIDPFLYLRDVFGKIAAHPINRLDELLPDRWLETEGSLMKSRASNA